MMKPLMNVLVHPSWPYDSYNLFVRLCTSRMIYAICMILNSKNWKRGCLTDMQTTFDVTPASINRGEHLGLQTLCVGGPELEEKPTGETTWMAVAISRHISQAAEIHRFCQRSSEEIYRGKGKTFRTRSTVSNQIWDEGWMSMPAVTQHS